MRGYKGATRTLLRALSKALKEQQTLIEGLGCEKMPRRLGCTLFLAGIK